MNTELPKDWKLVRLGDFVKTEKGKKPKRVSTIKTKECSIPYVNIKAFEKNIVDEFTDGVGCVICEDDDFLMVWDGSRSGYVGKAIKGALGSTLVRLTFPGIDQNYTYYFLQSKYLEINTRAKGVGIPHVDPNLLWNYSFPIPSLPEQHRIVAKLEELLSELEKGKEQLNTALDQLKVYHQAVLKHAFEGKLTNKDAKDGELQKGWKWKQIREITSVLGDGLHGTPEYLDKGDYYFINGNNLSDGKILLKDNTKRVSSSEYEKHKKNLNERTILVSINGTLGNTAFYNGEKVILGKSACYFNIIDKVDKHYIRYIITGQRFLNYADKTATGSTIKNVSLKSMREFEIPLPSTLEEQHHIVEEIECRLSVADKLEETITAGLQQSETLRQSILKKAFEGGLV
jgi:type I restriction enzyme, S subunit